MVAGKQASIYVTGEPITMTDETTATADHKTYQIYNEAKQLLDCETTIVVKVNGVQGSNGFKVNYLLGKVIFTTARNTEDVITISGKYIPKSLAVTAHEFSFGKGVDVADVTRFGDTHKRKLPMQKFAYGTISQWDVTDTFFTDALLSSTPKYIIFNSGVEGTAPKIALAYFEKEEIKAAVGNPQDATVSFISANEQIS
jgi:hypothetical protein